LPHKYGLRGGGEGDALGGRTYTETLSKESARGSMWMNESRKKTRMQEMEKSGT